jgi:phage/conjugal plasmid C-4 type zinc finger TraR family protein
VTDIYDRATEIEEQQRQQALQEHNRRAGLAGKTIADSAVECIVCDETITDDRRQALPGVQTCVACQSELERAVKRNFA